MSELPLPRRSVRDFCKHHGLSRAQYLDLRAKAKVIPKSYDSMLLEKDQRALMREIGAEKHSDQLMRKIRERPRVTTRFVPRTAKPPVDYEVQIARMADSLSKWRAPLTELAKGHNSVNGRGRCRRCHEEAPCTTKKTLTELDNEFVERMAVADSGQFESVDAKQRLDQLRDARDRWRRALTRLTIEHMLEDAKGRCTVCAVRGPCDVKKAVTRVNKGIAREIEKFATMDEGQLEVALGNRRQITRSWDDEDDYRDAADAGTS